MAKKMSTKAHVGPFSGDALKTRLQPKYDGGSNVVSSETPTPKNGGIPEPEHKVFPQYRDS